MSDLTVIIACKDRDKNVRFCLSSIAHSSYRPEVIIVDFGSRVSLETLAPSFPWVQFIRIPNAGMFHKTRALNIGIRAAKTEYVCLTDADQIFAPNFFEEVYQAVQQEKSFVMCTTYFLGYIPAGISCSNLDADTYQALLNLAKNNCKAPLGEGCCNGVDLDWLLRVNGHDERYIGWGFEDKDLARRAQYSNYTLVRLDEKTSMVHLPHERDTKYFNKTFRLQNESLFKTLLQTTQTVVNVGVPWGMP